MNLEYIELSRSKRLSQWLRHRLSSTFALDTQLWTFAIAALWVLSCAAIVAAVMGMPTGFGVMFDIIAGISFNTIVMPLSSTVIAALLAIVGLRVPRFTSGSILYAGVLCYFIFYFSEFGVLGAIIFSVIYVIFAAMVGLFIGWLARNWDKRWLRAWTMTLVGIVTLVGVYMSYGTPLTLAVMSSADRDADAAVSLDNGEVRTLSTLLSDPSEPGGHNYSYFTYGSGQDRQRVEFGARVDMLSTPVNAEAYISDWPWLRQKFWGFNETELPLNGRVWMPEGEGDFPLVLMVHGNHLMEQFSDGGYGYLGELLASRGFAAISIDENFLNYSVWSGIPDEDMKARAWILLKHIQQIQEFAQQEGSPFYNKIDFQQLALLGHSRGGQAAAMAADGYRWFKDDDELPASVSYDIQAVIALAPTDTVVDDQQSELRNVSYLTLQGAKDSDLVNFYGDRQYGRVSYSYGSMGFKASLYIEDANHSQFNTEWGESDHAYPTGLFIRPKSQLEDDQQRRIAKVYVAAFLETVFHKSSEYNPLFRNYRAGQDLLPSTRYYSQYESGSTKKFASFGEEERTVLSSGTSASATNMIDWQHVEALDRQGFGKGDKGVALEWEKDASYTVHLKPSSLNASEENSLVFSMANMEWRSPEMDIEITDQAGVSVRLPLSQFMTIQPLPVADFTWLPGMEAVLSDGKFKNSAEPVFQTYELPLRVFTEADAQFNPAEWNKLTFYFSGGPGRVMLDDLGLISE